MINLVRYFGLSLCVLLLIIPFNSSAQHRNDKWCFGDSAGIDFTNSNNPITFTTSAKTRGSCVSICDSNSNLQFFAYTRATVNGNTTLVKDKFHQLMTNGNNIVGEGWYMELVIVPYPNNATMYYLFTLGVAGSSLTGLYYSTIDMSLNNGLGEVTQKNIQLLPDAANDGLAAVKHGNGRDWWVIHRRYGGGPNNLFYKYLISPAGITGPFTQNIGTITNTNTLRYVFNKEGNKIACVQYDGLCETFDFDRCTGMLSNHIFLRANAVAFSPKAEFVSCEFSPSSKYLYLSTNGYASPSELLQIDLTKPNPFADADTLFSFNQFVASGGFLKRAPDNKIYWSRIYYDGFNDYPYPDTTYNMYNMNLSVINSPDSAGVKCDFSPYSFYLGGARTYWGLPNNPNYDMGPDTGSVCDSLGLSSPPAPQRGDQQLYTTYVAAWEKLFINAQNLKGKNVTVSIYDGKGSLKFEVRGLKSNAGYFTIDVNCAGGSPSGACPDRSVGVGGARWANGLYVVHLQTEKEVLSKKFIKE